jgi:hypothetical protein
MNPMEKDVAELIRAAGPLTGAEIRDRVSGESLALWRACMSCDALEMRTLGNRYLRLDQQVEGYARLSPSILREFLTYSVTGLAGDPAPLEKRACEVASRIEEISRAKLGLARHFVEGIRSRFEGEWPEDRVCFILAGDIVYRMAHDVPRPERSTGKMVRGSDIDLIVVLSDDVPESFITSLDGAIYREKYRTLIAPSIKEEIDYIMKKMERVHEQLRFDTFKHMVACKILQEGAHLYGSRPMFDAIKALLQEKGVAGKLDDLEKQARASREAAEDYLLHGVPGKIERGDLVLFYSSEESEEFE